MTATPAHRAILVWREPAQEAIPCNAKPRTSATTSGPATRAPARAALRPSPTARPATTGIRRPRGMPAPRACARAPSPAPRSLMSTRATHTHLCGSQRRQPLVLGRQYLWTTGHWGDGQERDQRQGRIRRGMRRREQRLGRWLHGLQDRKVLWHRVHSQRRMSRRRDLRSWHRPLPESGQDRWNRMHKQRVHAGRHLPGRGVQPRRRRAVPGHPRRMPRGRDLRDQYRELYQPSARQDQLQHLSCRAALRKSRIAPRRAIACTSWRSTGDTANRAGSMRQRATFFPSRAQSAPSLWT